MIRASTTNQESGRDWSASVLAWGYCLTLIIACLVVLSAPNASAQTQVPTASTSTATNSESPRAADVFARARELYASEGPKVALPEFEKALALFRKDNDKKGEAITLGLIGNCYKKFGDFSKAEDYLQRALAMKRALGDRAEEGRSLSHLGLLHWEMSDYPKAIEYLNTAIGIGSELKDRTLEGSARNNLGLVYDELGEYRRSLEQYDKALELYRGTNFERGISDTLGNIGGIPLLLGEYAKALGYYQQALEIDERNNLKPGICLDLQNIGLAYTGLGRLSEALQAFDRSIKLASEGGLKKEEADSRKGKGSALLQLGKYDQARAELRQALQVYEQAGLHQQLIEGLESLGNLNLRLGDAASAESDYRRALEISRRINHPRGVTKNLIALGDIEWRRKRFNQAAAIYRDALARATETKDRDSETGARIQLALTLRSLNQLNEAAKESQLAAEIARSTQARLLAAEALYAQGEIARAGNQPQIALKHFGDGREIARAANNPELSWRFDYGRGQTLEALNRNDESLTSYEAAVKTIEQVRAELSEERFRAGYIEDKYQVYVALVRLLLKMGKVDQAFHFSEKLRARSYLDLLSRSRPPIRSELQRQKETVLRNRVRDLQRKIEDEAAKTIPERRREAFDLFSKELSAAELEYANFLDDLRSTDVSYAATRALNVPGSAEVQKHLPAGTALVEYVVAEDSLQIFVLTAGELRAKSVPVRAADLQRKVEFLRDVLLRKNTSDWKLPAESLYQTLIAPIADADWLRGIKSIYVVPHSFLHYLPFAVLTKGAALPSSSGPSLAKKGGPPCLCEDPRCLCGENVRQKTHHRGTEIAPRHRAQFNRQAPGKGSFDRLLIDDYVLAYLPAAALLVHGSKAGVSSNSILAMAPASTRLRYAQQESQNISMFFTKQRTVLLGNRATETSFKRLADQFDVVHFSTHGYFNKVNPLLSGVALEADGQEDGRLEVHEILDLRMKAKLVTLSACDTALGSGYFAEVPAGDDLVGLTRAFLFAGSPTVMASLWEVNDLSAVRLMRSFYSGLGRGDKATALRNAQREMRARGPYRHPYYWSAFVMVGDMK